MTCVAWAAAAAAGEEAETRGEDGEDGGDDGEAESLMEDSARALAAGCRIAAAAERRGGRAGAVGGAEQHADIRRDKMDRATVENAIDVRTRLLLFSLLSRGVLGSLHGCVSTGKEANVYSARRGDDGGADERGDGEGAAPQWLAVKVFKTAVLSFRDRDKYVSGEYRFRAGYRRHNSREMVRLWAEKEFRNLARLRAAAVPAPRAHTLSSHVLVMTFIGNDGWSAPRLKDVAAALKATRLRALYVRCAVYMRRMFVRAKLVHGDLSEYNMLLTHAGRLIFIDVSQSVEHDHPYALDFLRRDCVQVSRFFGRALLAAGGEHRERGGTALPTVRALFDFVLARPSETEARRGRASDAVATAAAKHVHEDGALAAMEELSLDERERVDALMEQAESRAEEAFGEVDDGDGGSDASDDPMSASKRAKESEMRRRVDEQVFLRTPLPRSALELEELQCLSQEALQYATMFGVTAAPPEDEGDDDDDDDDEEEEEEDEEEEEEDREGDNDSAEGRAALAKQGEEAKTEEEQRMERKARKKMVKEEAREKRKVKLPKKVKKRKETVAKQRRHRR